MNYVFIIFCLVAVVSLFLPWKKIFGTDYNGPNAYQKGYDSAIEEIEKGEDPGELFYQCYYNVTEYDEYDKGWMKACQDKGFVKKD